MSTAAEVGINLKAETGSFSAKMGQAGSDLKKFGKDAKEAQGLLGGLKKSFGEESTFGGSLKLLKGAGAIAGIGLAAGLLKQLSEDMAGANLQFKRGQMTSGQYFGTLVANLPVLKQVGEALQSMDDSFSGRTALNAEVNATNKYLSPIEDARVEALRGASVSGLSGTKRELATRKAQLQADLEAIAEQRINAQNDPTVSQKAYADIREAAAQATAAKIKQAEADYADIRRKGISEDIGREKEHEGRLADIRDAGHVRRLRASGNNEFAEIVALEASFNQQIRATTEGYRKLIDAETDGLRKRKLIRERDQEVGALKDQRDQAGRDLEKLQQRDAERRIANLESETTQTDLKAGGYDFLAAREQIIQEGGNRILDLQQKQGKIGGEEQEKIRKLTLKKLDALEEQDRKQRFEKERQLQEKISDLQADVTDRQLRRNGGGVAADVIKAQREAQKANDDLLRDFNDNGAGLTFGQTDTGDTFAVQDLGGVLAAIQANDAVAQEKIVDALKGGIGSLPNALERRFDFSVDGVQSEAARTAQAQLKGIQLMVKEIGKGNNLLAKLTEPVAVLAGNF